MFVAAYKAVHYTDCGDMQLTFPADSTVSTMSLSVCVSNCLTQSPVFVDGHD